MLLATEFNMEDAIAVAKEEGEAKGEARGEARGMKKLLALWEKWDNSEIFYIGITIIWL